MKNANSHPNEDRLSRDNYSDTSRNEHPGGPEQHGSGRDSYSNSNRPQYGAQPDRFRHEQHERYDYNAPRGDYASENESRGNVFRFGREAQFPQDQFGGYGEGQRVNNFGYPETQRRGISYGQDFSGPGPFGQHRPYFYANDQGDPGAYWQNQSFLNSQYRGAQGNPGDYFQHSQQRSSGGHTGDPRNGYGGWGPTGGSTTDHSHPRHGDHDYHQWRTEQIQNLDRDYDDWRQQRYNKFADEFNNWRSSKLNRDEQKIGDTTSPTDKAGAAQASGTRVTQSPTGTK